MRSVAGGERDQLAVAQQLLRAHGFPDVPVDGKPTRSTERALRAFQERNGLPATGEPDESTLAALRGEPYIPPRRPKPHKPEPHHPSHPVGPPLEPIIPGSRFPTNRVIAFLGPYIAIASGLAAAWLSTNFPGLDLDTNETAAAITQGATFALGALITWALHHKWLTGWQQWEQGVLDYHRAKLELADVAAAAAAPAYDPYDPATFRNGNGTGNGNGNGWAAYAVPDYAG